jgi:hypothetical protein
MCDKLKARKTNTDKICEHKDTIMKKKFRGFSPPANYTDRATAACREVSANFSG